MRRLPVVASFLFLLPVAAWGHPGHGTHLGSGFAHLLTDHPLLLFLVGMALGGCLLAWRRLRS